MIVQYYRIGPSQLDGWKTWSMRTATVGERARVVGPRRMQMHDSDAMAGVEGPELIFLVWEMQKCGGGLHMLARFLHDRNIGRNCDDGVYAAIAACIRH